MHSHLPAAGPHQADPQGGRLYPPPPADDPRDAESLDVWGFQDTTFRVNARGHVEVTGDRYPDLSGHELPNLLPWFRGVVGLPVEPENRNEPHYPPAIPDPLPAPGLISELLGCFAADQLSSEPRVRLRHGHGHTQADMFAIKHGRLPRVPDLVVYPTDEDQVQALVEAAHRHGATLIPFGGGTNVTEALRCPSDETRVIVSVDMRRMNRILWIDPVNRMACIQAGAVGRTIMRQLAEYGFTMGHEPDSVEFSTLGGWISTHASGMKKNRYGNIEDLVLALSAATPQGELSRPGAP
ncbi:MAG TPA: FAD-dependent oxidoreductase, partial [Stenomitos sp.]